MIGHPSLSSSKGPDFFIVAEVGGTILASPVSTAELDVTDKFVRSISLSRENSEFGHGIAMMEVLLQRG